MATTADPEQLATLGQALGSLGERLPAAQAETGALRLVDQIIRMTESDRFPGFRGWTCHGPGLDRGPSRSIRP